MVKFYGYEDKESIRIATYFKFKLELAISIVICILISTILILVGWWLFIVIPLIIEIIFIAKRYQIANRNYIRRRNKHIISLRHVFKTDNFSLYMDGERVRTYQKVRLYATRNIIKRYDRWLLIKIDRKAYIVEEKDYLIGSVYGFLSEIKYKFGAKNEIEFLLPRLGKYERTSLMFSAPTKIPNPLKIWYSKGMHKRIYIYQKDNEKYSYVIELLHQCDEWLQPKIGDYGYWFISKKEEIEYDSIEEAHRAVNHQTKRMIYREDYFD